MAETYPERSSRVFQIARDAGIPWESPRADELSDDAFLTFVEAYRKWATTRDVALQNHISRTDSFFRCHIPYTPRAFAVAQQILWYLDEIIMRDPVAVITSDPLPDDLRNKKENLSQVLGVLAHFRSAIDGGYVLLGSEGVFPSSAKDEPPETLRALAQDEELAPALDAAVRYGLDVRPDSNGRDCVVYDAYLDSGGVIGWRMETVEAGTSSASYRVGEELPRIPRERFGEVLGNDVLDQVRHLYPREVHRTLLVLERAASLDAAAIFDRDVDERIVRLAGNTLADERRQGAAVGALNLTLPYLRGVPPDRLLDLRDAVPVAFREFRARMVDIVFKSMNEEPKHSGEMARMLVDRDVLPAVAMLDAEMKAAATRVKVLGFGGPVAAATGALIGSLLGVTLAELLPIIVGGGLAGMKGKADYQSDAAKAQRNPFYFLWLTRGT